MNLALIIISLLWIFLGVLLILYTEASRNYLKKVFYIERIRLLAAIPILVGFILVFGAFSQKGMILWLALILGVLALAKGLYVAFGPVVRIRKILDWWFYGTDETTIRLWGLIIFILGTVLFFICYD